MLNTISHKLIGIAAFAVFQIVVISGISAYKMDKIGSEIHSISAYDIPLMKAITQFSEDQLHAEIYYEKAILHGVLWMEGNEAEKPLFDKYINNFNKTSKTALKEVVGSASLIESILREKNSKKEETKFTTLKGDILSLHKSVLDLKSMMDSSFTHIESKNKKVFSTTLKVIEKKIDVTNEEASSILHDIQEFTQLAANTAEEDEIRALKLIVVFGLLSLVIFTIFCTYISRTITQSICSINDKLDDLTQGDGDLTIELTVDSKDELAITALKINEFIKKLRHIIQGVNVSADSLGSSSSNAIEVLERTVIDISQQKNETEMVAAAVYEMSQTIHEVAQSTATASSSAENILEHVREASAKANSSQGIMGDLGNELDQTSVVIDQLSEETKNIETVLDSIKGISEQTNLLALNAAIEAARAGETGRGFAVVADEVRSLSVKTQSSTVEIQKLISTLQQKSRDAVECMHISGKKASACLLESQSSAVALDSAMTAVHSINDMNSQIATAAEEQSSVADEISKNLENIQVIAERTDIGSQKTSEANQNIACQLISLHSDLNQFKVQ